MTKIIKTNFTNSHDIYVELYPNSILQPTHKIRCMIVGSVITAITAKVMLWFGTSPLSGCALPIGAYKNFYII